MSGMAPPTKRMKWARELLHFPIPKALSELLTEGSPQEITARLREDYFPEPVSIDTHRFHFEHLLYLEEYRTECVDVMLIRASA